VNKPGADTARHRDRHRTARQALQGHPRALHTAERHLHGEVLIGVRVLSAAVVRKRDLLAGVDATGEGSGLRERLPAPGVRDVLAYGCLSVWPFRGNPSEGWRHSYQRDVMAPEPVSLRRLCSDRPDRGCTGRSKARPGRTKSRAGLRLLMEPEGDDAVPAKFSLLSSV
jgi:hypothetical protein